MQVLQIAGSLESWGGIERYICNLGNGLLAGGQSVTVACQVGTPLVTHWDGEKVITGRPRAHRLTATSQYLRILKGKRFDVIHSHYSPDFWATAIAARIAKVPRIVLTRHLALPWARPKAKLLSSLYDQMICVSDAVRQELESSGVSKDKLTVAKMGVQQLAPTASRQIVRDRFGIANNRFAVGFVGRLTVEKGAKTLLHSLEFCDQVEAHLFGDGPQREELETTAKNMNSGNVFFHGHLNDVADAMEAVDTVVVPSEWKEAFPAVVLEAMSLGRPVIGSRIGGIPEIIDDGRNGLLFSPGEPIDLASAIVRLQTQPDFARLIGINGKETQEKEFTIAEMGVRFRKVYESMAPAR